ncbi:MAG: dependent oxidoreductase [Chthoniobacteraceae bacterium]|nr:dependent oxidoreductase [Chthoniobacteraceae bacterium]
MIFSGRIGPGRGRVGGFMDYDIVIIGGSLSGASTAILLRRECPGLRVLVVERSAKFGRRVGEATVEISGFFLGRVLGLAGFLNESQLIKQGMRFWFANEQTQSLSDSSEIGPRYHVRLPSWQLDRSVVDEEVLRRAVEAGAELRRPAQVTAVELAAGGEQVVTLREADASTTVRCRWVVDASGFAALLARQQGWWRQNLEHPTASAWARWQGVKDWDGRALAEKFPDWANACYGSRNTATNHIVGDGWWSWWIPLKGGDVSVGVVFDQRIANFPSGEMSVGERLKEFLSRHPVGAELLSNATLVDGDTHWRKNLPYSTTQFAGDGFVLVGDAAAFLDPLYSPGMDWISFTVTASVALIVAEQRGDPIDSLIEKHNNDFSKSYQRWFQAIYKDKYEYVGEFDLMRLAFLMDLGLYYLGVVSQPFKFGAQSLRVPPFSLNVASPVFYFMRAYNRRFASMARERRRRSQWGRANNARRYLFQSFSLSPKDLPRILGAATQWAWLELTEGWRSWR